VHGKFLIDSNMKKLIDLEITQKDWEIIKNDAISNYNSRRLSNPLKSWFLAIDKWLNLRGYEIRKKDGNESSK